MKNTKKKMLLFMIILLMLTTCSSGESYTVQEDTCFYKGDMQIGFEDCEFASSIDEFIDICYMSDASVVDEREIAAQGGYTLIYAELSVSPSAAMEIEGKSADTEWHYYIHDGENDFIDVRLTSKEYCTEDLEKYLMSYIK